METVLHLLVSITRRSTMRAFVLPDFERQPTLADIPMPEAGPGEVLVRVHAASVNGIDLSVASGRLQGMMEYRFPVVLGKDFAGTVEAVGTGVTGWRRTSSLDACGCRSSVPTSSTSSVRRWPTTPLARGAS